MGPLSAPQVPRTIGLFGPFWRPDVPPFPGAALGAAPDAPDGEAPGPDADPVETFPAWSPPATPPLLVSSADPCSLAAPEDPFAWRSASRLSCDPQPDAIMPKAKISGMSLWRRMRVVNVALPFDLESVPPSPLAVPDRQRERVRFSGSQRVFP
jgi:hypothetical protein